MVFAGGSWNYFIIVLSAAVFMRAAVGLYPYSGAGNPPMYGDYEAQRHWMEITYSLPLSQWYVNSSSNNLEYWGLDYPPLTAYHSWILGATSAYINPEWIALNTSHGYESYYHKLFMRCSVFVTDVLVYFPAVIAYTSYIMLCFRSHDYCVLETQKMVMIFIILCQPALILIDYGHFQYNSLSLGLTLWGVTAVMGDWNVVGSIAFCLAMNYKQMELYHSLPFFFYLLGKASISTDKKLDFILVVMKLALAVIVIFGICWIPFFFFSGTQGFHEVIVRIFPFSRGLYEDKVASFWCSLSTLFKIRDIFSRKVLVFMSAGITLSVMIPSLFNLMRYPTAYRFSLSLVISSLSFFLFSFHVHEKTILLVTLPISLLITQHPLLVVWFNVVAVFSMYPLLVRDGLSISTWAVSGLFIIVALFTFNLYTARKYHYYESLMLTLSLSVLLLICSFSHIIPPPISLPDIFAVLISCYCCLLFMATLAYFSYVQLSLQRNTEEQCQFPWDHRMYQIIGRSSINLILSNRDHKE